METTENTGTDAAGADMTRKGASGRAPVSTHLGVWTSRPLAVAASLLLFSWLSILAFEGKSHGGGAGTHRDHPPRRGHT